MSIREDRELVQALCEIDEGLSEWEVNFIESLGKQVESEMFDGISIKQCARAEEIAERYGI